MKTFLEVGAYYGYANAVLAREFPQLKIVGVDFPSCMKELNAEFKEPNLEFLSGYGLEMLEKGEIQGDIVYFVSTATRIKNLELKRYLRVIRKTGKYVVFNELLSPLADGTVVDPAHVAEHNSVPIIYKNADPSYPPHYIHNYRLLAEKEGFETLHYHVYMPEFTDHYRIEMVARVK